VVPGGEHVIEMRYRPAALRWGALLAFAAAAGLGSAVFLQRRGRDQTLRESRLSQ
jgi:hypothetical protein